MLGAKQLFCKYAAPLHFSPFSWDGRRLPCNNEGLLSLPTDRCPTEPRSIAEAKCENVWMEVCTKVAAAALVSVPWRVSWVGLG